MDKGNGQVIRVVVHNELRSDSTVERYLAAKVQWKPSLYDRVNMPKVTSQSK